VTVSTIWDPLRRKEVPLTPEERVRQWFIGILHEDCGVPFSLMGSEVELHYGKAGKIYRADIVVFGHEAAPVAVVECKRPEVELTQEVLEQALRYDMVLDVDYLFITNGRQTRIAHREGGRFVFLGKLPDYKEMDR